MRLLVLINSLVFLYFFTSSLQSCTKWPVESDPDGGGIDTTMISDTMVVDTMTIDTQAQYTINPLLEGCGCPDSLTQVYIENNGLLTFEAESGRYSGSTQWATASLLRNYNGRGYIVWNGNDFFSDPGRGNITYKIRISTPGTYRFVWNSRIGKGDSNTEHNDTWLRIADAKHYYGKRDTDGHIVYPKGTRQEPLAASSGQSSTTPEGAGRDGWFKIYMNMVGEWQWRATTSDKDPHNIFAVFDAPGDYTIELSGRSNGHAIDRLLLYNESYSLFAASNTNNGLSGVVCE